MKSYIYSKPTSKGIQSLYLVNDGEEYLLFCQNYRRGVQDYFRRGVIIDEAINPKRAHFDEALIRTIKKITSYIKYIEKEYDIQVLEKTKEHYRKKRKRCREYAA